MTADPHVLLRRPLRFEPNPVYTFYEGGALWRRFRGLDEPEDSRWAEDWIASCIPSRTAAPDGGTQGLSIISDGSTAGTPLASLIQAHPEEMLGADWVDRWGADPRVQVKLVSPRSRVPLHVHPDAAFAQTHLASPCGKAEAWIVLEAPGEEGEPAHAGIGFREGVTEQSVAAAIRSQEQSALLDLVHRTPIEAGDVIFVPPGLPHYISGGTFFVEIQEPADLGILAEWEGFVDSPSAATGGLDFETALSCFEIRPQSRETALSAAFQSLRTARDRDGVREIELLGETAHPYFEARRVEVRSRYSPDSATYYVAVAIDGSARVEGDGWSETITAGDAFAFPAGLGHTYIVDSDRFVMITANGPPP